MSSQRLAAAPLNGGFPSLEALHAAVIESAADAVISENPAGVVTSWNEGAVRLFEYTAEEMLGQSSQRLIPPGREEEAEEMQRRTQHGERVDAFETQRIARDGRVMEVSLSAAPLRNRAGEILGVTMIARGIARRRTAEEELRASGEAAAAEAARLARLKDDFVAGISHELRAPLQTILNWTRLLRSGPASTENLREGLATIESQAVTQLRLVEQMPEMNRILTGEFELDLNELDLADVLRTTLQISGPFLQAHGLRLALELEAGPKPVLGNAPRLQLALELLFAAAVKSTPAGGAVFVGMQTENGWTRLSIRDTGAGLSPEALPFVFERLSPEDASRPAIPGVPGLGLSIVKTLIELHEGTIAVESEGVDRGTTFCLDLPVAEVSLLQVGDSADAEPGKPRRLPRLDGLSLVVVDDEIEARDMLRRVLGTLGAEVRTASNMAEALEALAAGIPDLLISDIGMPDHDGFELIRHIRSLPQAEGGRVPALALSADDSIQQRALAVTSGFQMFLSKPTDALELLGIVKVLTRSTEG